MMMTLHTCPTLDRVRDTFQDGEVRFGLFELIVDSIHYFLIKSSDMVHKAHNEQPCCCCYCCCCCCCCCGSIRTFFSGLENLILPPPAAVNKWRYLRTCSRFCRIRIRIRNVRKLKDSKSVGKLLKIDSKIVCLENLK